LIENFIAHAIVATYLDCEISLHKCAKNIQ